MCTLKEEDRWAMLETTAYAIESCYDVIVIGAGLAGVMAAVAMLRSGVRVLLLDANEIYPHSFKAEKLGNDHSRQFRRLGMLDAILPAATPIRELLEAHHGTRVLRKPVEHYGIAYHDLINALRRNLPSAIALKIGKVRRIETGPDRQRLTLDDGQSIEARLLVLASGRWHNLFSQLGLRRTTVSHMHSLSFGFSVASTRANDFDFDEMTYWGDPGSEDLPYATFFRIGDGMRVNAFAYWNAGDERTHAFLEDPSGVLQRRMPGLADAVGPFEHVGRAESCPLHLEATEGHLQPGLVVVGDAFGTVCPAAGTGVVKALNDVECLCDELVPNWLSTPGMGLEKISQFYSHPRKTACDRSGMRMSMRMRKTAVDNGWRWRLRRQARSFKRSLSAMRARHRQKSTPSEQPLGRVAERVEPHPKPVHH